MLYLKGKVVLDFERTFLKPVKLSISRISFLSIPYLSLLRVPLFLPFSLCLLVIGVSANTARTYRKFCASARHQGKERSRRQVVHLRRGIAV